MGHVGFITWEVRALNTALFPPPCLLDRQHPYRGVAHLATFCPFSPCLHTHACFCAQCQTQGLPRRSSCGTCFYDRRKGENEKRLVGALVDMLWLEPAGEGSGLRAGSSGRDRGELHWLQPLQAQAWVLFLEVGPSSSRICLFHINQHWRREGLDVKTMMNTWTLQKGFPLITITVRGRNVHMKQEYYVKGVANAPETG